MSDERPPTPENYSDYFERRAAEERGKADSATSDFTRDQHLELARIFTRMARKFRGGA